jgi:hypothetical protein
VTRRRLDRAISWPPVARGSHVAGRRVIDFGSAVDQHTTGVNVRNIFRCIAMALAASWICFGSTPLLAQSVSSKIEQTLKETGFTYTTHNATTWSIDFERKKLGKFKVILSTGSEILVTFAILAKKANINKTPKLMDALLSANHEYDYVKVGLDKDGDMFVRIDDWIPTVNARHLKETINQVANASEEVYVKVADSIRR